eukprot:9492078-Pyramimonas_sp.AAC.1
MLKATRPPSVKLLGTLKTNARGAEGWSRILNTGRLRVLASGTYVVRNCQAKRSTCPTDVS